MTTFQFSVYKRKGWSLPFMAQFALFALCLVVVFTGCNSGSSSQNQEGSSSNTNKAGPSEKASEREESGKEKVLMFFGNSITAGYGLEKSQAFPALIQEKIDSLGLNYRVVNAGVSGETTAGGNSRIDWVLEKQKVDIFVLELGGNDGLRGIPTEETKKNLISIIGKVRETYPSAKIILAGMRVPPNMGEKYAGDFRQVFREVSEARKVHLMPFILKDVGGEPSLNQPDGIHPNIKGHKIVAENVWEVVKPFLVEEKAS